MGQFTFIAVLVLAIPLTGMGFVQAMRHPRLSASRAFDASMNLAVLIVGIPTMIFFIFLAMTIAILVFIPQSTGITQVVSAALLLSMVAMVLFQMWYIYSTLQRSAKYHGLSILEYIAIRFNQEEQKQQKEERKARGERIDALYERIPEFKEEIRPSKLATSQPGVSLSMREYEYASIRHPLLAFLKGLFPGIIATFLGAIVYVAFFLFLAMMAGF
ncbi:MAG: hypothetical protein ACE5OZ_13605 [Candidatus Heimdallarchaeota archaeon]